MDAEALEPGGTTLVVTFATGNQLRPPGGQEQRRFPQDASSRSHAGQHTAAHHPHRAVGNDGKTQAILRRAAAATHHPHRAVRRTRAQSFTGHCHGPPQGSVARSVPRREPPGAEPSIGWPHRLHPMNAHRRSGRGVRPPRPATAAARMTTGVFAFRPSQILCCS